MALVDDIAAKGEKIYRDRYKDEYEAKYLGKIVGIDIDSGRAFVGSSPEEVTMAADATSSHGLLYVFKVGGPGVYHLSRLTANASKSVF
jgi:hypothetical protein